MLTILARSRVVLQMKELKNRTGNGQETDGVELAATTMRGLRSNLCVIFEVEGGRYGRHGVATCVGTSHIEGTKATLTTWIEKDTITMNHPGPSRQGGTPSDTEHEDTHRFYIGPRGRGRQWERRCGRRRCGRRWNYNDRKVRSDVRWTDGCPYRRHDTARLERHPEQQHGHRTGS